MHLVDFIRRIYHDARSPERQRHTEYKQAAKRQIPLLLKKHFLGVPPPHILVLLPTHHYFIKSENTLMMFPYLHRLMSNGRWTLNDTWRLK